MVSRSFDSESKGSGVEIRKSDVNENGSPNEGGNPVLDGRTKDMSLHGADAALDLSGENEQPVLRRRKWTAPLSCEGPIDVVAGILSS